MTISGAAIGFVRRSAFVHGDTDQDWFCIDLAAGELDRFGVQKTAGSTVDPTLTLRDPAGNQLAFGNDSGPGFNRDAEILITAPYTGTYFLDVDGVGSATGDDFLSFA